MFRSGDNDGWHDLLNRSLRVARKSEEQSSHRFTQRRTEKMVPRAAGPGKIARRKNEAAPPRHGMTTRSRAVAARLLPPEILFLVAEALADSGANKSLLEMTLMSRSMRALLLPALLRDINMLRKGGAWTAPRLRAFLAGPADTFRHIKSLNCAVHAATDIEDDSGVPCFTDHVIQLIDKCSDTLNRIRITSSTNCAHLDAMYAIVCDSYSVTDVSLVLLDQARGFADDLVEFPPRLRKLEIDCAEHELPPEFYESLEAVDSLEEWKFNFAMSEPFRPPGPKLASKLTGFRVDSNCVAQLLDVPGMRPEKIRDMEIPFVADTPFGYTQEKAIETSQLGLLKMLSERCISLRSLEIYGLRMNALAQLDSFPANWRTVLAFNPTVQMELASYREVRSKIESSNVEKFVAHFQGFRLLHQLAEPDMLVHFNGLKGFTVSVSESLEDLMAEEEIAEEEFMLGLMGLY